MRRALQAVAVSIGGVALAFSGAGAGVASAKAGNAPTTCSGGDIASGTYASLTVTGVCTVPAGSDVTITHNLSIAPGATFDAQTDSHVAIGGNVIAGAGSMFGLGCTFAHPCDDTGNPPADGTTHDTVGGNVTLNGVYNAALNGDTIGGNLTSSGGGAGLLDPETDFVPFSIKDDVVHGNITVTNLTTVWFGVIRTQVGKNVTLQNIQLSDPDGNEYVSDTISGNLNCHGDSPAPQVGDSEGAPNVVGKHANGQCAGLTG
jgi:hypothetical protein